MRTPVDPSEPYEVQFEAQAVPHSWFLVAVDLYDQAQVLFATRTTQQWSLTGEGPAIKWDGANRAAFLLGGFALENMIKAFLVYENPSWISGGKLAKQLKSHKITHLVNLSTRMPNSSGVQEILGAFESGLDDWARYPCGSTWEKTKSPHVLDSDQWYVFIDFFSQCGQKMMELLRERWKGPHAFEGCYTMDGFFEPLANR